MLEEWDRIPARREGELNLPDRTAAFHELHERGPLTTAASYDAAVQTCHDAEVAADRESSEAEGEEPMGDLLNTFYDRWCPVRCRWPPSRRRSLARWPSHLRARRPRWFRSTSAEGC